MPTLRGWQEAARVRYERLQQKDVLINATPGAGKTTAALAIVEPYLRSGRIQRLVVAVPSAHLQTQWRDAAATWGIHLSAEFVNRHGQEAQDFHGVVLTYQQVATEPTLHRTNCSRRPTFIILDEPHHIGENRAWGRAMQQACEPAAYRLLITGTAFRSDNNPIPFVRYENNRSVADFSYSYEEALRDGVCRPIIFPTYEGQMRWWTPNGERNATFADQIPEQERMRRLRTALTPDGAWLPEILREADQRLNELRQHEYPRAGGLVIAMDQRHAQEIVAILERITGERPALAISDEADSSQTIRRFAANSQKWLVSVKMVSEGVDIPRLCVGVYATVVLTELYFRQVVGRFVRKIPEPDVDPLAYLYLPKDDTLVQYVQRITEERDHVLFDPGTVTPPPPPPPNGDDDRPRTPSYVPISSEAQRDDVFHEGEAYRQAELQEAREFLQEAGVAGRISEVHGVLLMRVIKARVATEGGLDPTAPAGPTAPAHIPTPVPERALEEQKEPRRKLINRLVRIFCAQVNIDFEQGHTLLMRVTNKAMNQRTLPELERCVQCLQDWRQLAQQEDAPNAYTGWLTIAERYRGTR